MSQADGAWTNASRRVSKWWAPLVPPKKNGSKVIGVSDMSKQLQSSRDTQKKKKNHQLKSVFVLRSWGPPTNMAGNKKSLGIFECKRYIDSNGCVSIVSHVSFTKECILYDVDVGFHEVFLPQRLPWVHQRIDCSFPPPESPSCRELEILCSNLTFWQSNNGDCDFSRHRCCFKSRGFFYLFFYSTVKRFQDELSS